MNPLNAFRRHVAQDLSAFCHGQMPAEDLQRVTEHLETCGQCRRQYDEVRLGAWLAEHLPRLSAPPSLWDGMETRSREEARSTCQSARRSRYPRRRLSPRFVGACALVVALGVVAAAYVRWTRPRSGTTVSAAVVDLSGYLRGVEAAPAGNAHRTIAAAPHRFFGGDREEVLQVAGLAHAAGGGLPLPAYDLLANRVAVVGGERVAQLVYGRGEEAFSVFVAPSSVPFVLGGEPILDVDVEGIRCGKVDCPKQETYVFGAGDFHCVLVGKSLEPSKAAAIMRYFIAAHGGRR